MLNSLIQASGLIVFNLKTHTTLRSDQTNTVRIKVILLTLQTKKDHLLWGLLIKQMISELWLQFSNDSSLITEFDFFYVSATSTTHQAAIVISCSVIICLNLMSPKYHLFNNQENLLVSSCWQCFLLLRINVLQVLRGWSILPKQRKTCDMLTC